MVVPKGKMRKAKATQNDSGGSFASTEKEAQLGYHKHSSLLDHMVLDFDKISQGG